MILFSLYCWIAAGPDACLVLFQVTELSPEETESVTGGYGKSISHVIIGLKTVKGTKQLKLDPTIYDALIKEKVTFKFLFFIIWKNCSSFYFLISCKVCEAL